MNRLDFDGLIDFMVSQNELIDFEINSDDDVLRSSSASISSNDDQTIPTTTDYRSKHNIDKEDKSQTKSDRRKYYKRKPSYKTAFIPSIRIVKRDIRRKYIEYILPTIFNTHDEELFSNFLNSFCSPNIISCSFSDNSSINFTKVYLKGFNAIKRMHMINSYLLPDTIIKFSNNKICQRLNENGSRIIGDFQSVGTIVYVNQENNANLQKMEIIENDSDTSHGNESYDSYDGFVKQFQQSSQVLQFSGTYMMILDEQHRFVNISFACSQFHISPLSS